MECANGSCVHSKYYTVGRNIHTAWNLPLSLCVSSSLRKWTQPNKWMTHSTKTKVSIIDKFSLLVFGPALNLWNSKFNSSMPWDIATLNFPKKILSACNHWLKLFHRKFNLGNVTYLAWYKNSTKKWETLNNSTIEPFNWDTNDAAL